MSEASDLLRLREEYADREKRLQGSNRYSPLNPAHLYALHTRQSALISALARHGITHLADSDILELGCGSGGVLAELLALGAAHETLHGTDLIFGRIEEARNRLVGIPLTCADGQALPYRAGSFDLVFQFTVFSSVLDHAIRAKLAEEMLRVLRKPGGLIIWYDFWTNPTNPQTRGIGPSEIRRLFPGCRLALRRITLAPPLARRIVPVSWTLAHVLESLRIFNTHYLAAIRLV